MKISRKVITRLLAAVLILSAIIAAVTLSGTAAQRSTASPAAEMTAVATRGDLEVIVSGSGTLQSEMREDVRVPLSGSIVSFDAAAGRKVSAGDILAKLDVQDMELQLERKRLDIEIQERELQKLREEDTEAVLTARESGEINWSVREGDRVQSGSNIATITNLEYIEVTGRFSAADAAGITEGQSAAFNLPNYLLEFPGQVTSVSTIPRPGNRLPALSAFYEVTAEFDNARNLPNGVRGRMTVHTSSEKFQAAQPAALQLMEATNIRAPLAGTISKLHADSNSMVFEGRQITEITDSQLDRQISEAEARLRQYDFELSSLLAQQNSSVVQQSIYGSGSQISTEVQIQQLLMEISNLTAEIGRLREKRASGQLSTPAKGELQWIVKEGDRVQEGSIIATVQPLGRISTVGIFNKEQIDKISEGQVVEFYIFEYGITVQGRISRIGTVPKTAVAVAGPDALYDVTVKVKNPGNLDANLSGVLKIATTYGERRSVEAVSANIEPLVQRAPLSGSISIFANNGSYVDKGQILAQISDPDRAEQLQHQIATAELRLRQARLDLKDIVRQQTDRNNEAVITAPISGTILLPTQAAGVGSHVSQGTILATVVNYESMQVVIPVDELDVARIIPGQSVRITAHALPDTTIKGHVLKIAEEGSDRGGVSVFNATIAIEPTDGLRAGMTVEADILVKNLRDILLVPIESVISQGGRSIVHLLKDDGRTLPVEIQVGENDNSKIQIISGLEDGQQILIQGSTAENVPMPAPGGGMFGGMRRQQGTDQ
ncbi:MAG: HlyD family efflux transporter periplasmic adaptor subunit [Clostridium sp.]|nr:HlyD family efflux transporter periplasmic adaptor subunit [Clostridium sp.]